MDTIHAPKTDGTDAAASPTTPRPGRDDQPTEVLFPEAKRRERRRRLVVAAVVLLVAAVIAATIYGVSGSGRRPSAPALSHVGGGSRLTVADANVLKGHGNLAFISLGALFVIDGATGKTVAVTGTDANATAPSFSPNGRWLTYETGSGTTSWLTRVDGTDRRRLAGGATWQPDGQLVVSGTTSSSTYVVEANGALHRRGTSSGHVNVVVSGGETTYVYFVDTLNVVQPNSHGVEEIETAKTPNGHRTLWYSAKVSFTHEGGLAGTFLHPVAVLPGGRGLLLTIDNFCCNYADGQPLYELLTPGGRPHLLDTVLPGGISYGPNGTFALAGGGNRYAWMNKHVDLCNGSTATCSQAPAPRGMLTVSPAWSPNGRTLAYVEAKAGIDGEIGQPQISEWYATHHLWLLSARSKVPVEVQGSQGAIAPVWSSDSKSLMFVRNDELFLVASRGSMPVEVAGPLFHPTGWWSNSSQIAYYGEIDWNTQFAWSVRSS